jgi:hypothetical protein
MQELLNVKAAGTYSYHSTLKGYTAAHMLQKLSARTQTEDNRSALEEDGKAVDWENHTEYGGVMRLL